MADSGVTRRLTVTACSPMYTGHNKKGKPYTIFEVFAVDDAGQTVEAKLRSFDPLEINKLVEYEIERREDPRHGTSYTLKKPGRPDPPVDPRLLQRELVKQAEQITGLARRLALTEGALLDLATFLKNSGLQSEENPLPDVDELGSTAPASAALATDKDIKF